MCNYLDSIIEHIASNNNEAQDIHVFEEMAELQKELTKRRRGLNNREQIVEEAVDVLLAVEVLLRVYGVTDEEIKKWKKYKLERYERRIHGNA